MFTAMVRQRAHAQWNSGLWGSAKCPHNGQTYSPCVLGTMRRNPYAVMQ